VVARPFFPPLVAVEIKALACELPRQVGVQLSRFSSSDIAQEAIARGIVASISDRTVWRWLSKDAIRPWRYRSWIFPRDPHFEEKAGRVLDLYHGLWEGQPLGADEFVISADEKTSIQPRDRKHPTSPPRPNQNARVEHEYKRSGALAYLAAWDVRRAKVFGRCEPKSGIVSFERLVTQVMGQEPYRSAKRVFWIVDNGSSHRGELCIRRLTEAWPNLEVVHLPVHASWLNQVEIYFSILQRKLLSPSDFASLAELEECIFGFQERYEQTAKPFEWRFTRDDLAKLMAKLHTEQMPLPLAA
jgi:hypothetical protein